MGDVCEQSDKRFSEGLVTGRRFSERQSVTLTSVKSSRKEITVKATGDRRWYAK